MSRLLKFDNLNNTRDLGGMETKDGRKIKSGKLFRSGHLFFASEADLEKLTEQIGIIVDFRTDQEIFEKPDPWIEGVEYHHIPILSSWTAGITWEEKPDITEDEVLKKLRKDPDLAREYMCGIYKGFISNVFFRAKYREFVDLLLKGNDKAILWHCTAGKDRAGFASILVEEMLGLERELIIADYHKTNEYLVDEIRQITSVLFEQKTADEINERSIKYLFGAEKVYIESLYSAVEKFYGAFDVFIKDGLGVSLYEREQLKDMYLDQK